MEVGDGFYNIYMGFGGLDKIGFFETREDNLGKLRQ